MISYLIMEFSDISLVVVLAAVFGIIARNLKQSPIIGYIIAGVVLGASSMMADTHLLEQISKIGVMFLLFLLGLEIKINEFLYLGKDVVLASILQILLTFIFGFLILTVLGFSVIPALFVAVALSFSSTIVVVKLLSENRDMQSLFGRISVGILIVQDIVAILTLGIVSAYIKSVGGYKLALIPLKVILLIILVYVLSKRVLPWIYRRFVADSVEMIFIASIAWVFLFALVSEAIFGLSLEMGGLLAGISLSFLPAQPEIVSRSKPLKDFFLIMFFVYHGMEFAQESTISAGLLLPALLLILFVVFGKAIIVMSILGFTGYRRRTSFMTGLTLSQISEFSLILLGIGGAALGISVNQRAIITFVGLVSMSTTSYLYSSSTDLFKKLRRKLTIFEKEKTKESVFIKPVENNEHIVLLGCHRTGGIILNYLKKKREDIVVVDFDPQVYSKLSVQGINTVFGDVSDIDVLEAAKLNQASVVISTIPGFQENLEVLEHIKQAGKKPLIMSSARSRREAVVLYEKGADFVFVMDIIAGDHIKNILRLNGLKSHKIRKSGKVHFERLLSLRY